MTTLIRPEFIEGGVGERFPSSISAQSSTFSAADGILYIVDVSGGAVSVNLPAPSSGLKFMVKIVGDALTNNLTLVRNGTENIETIGANFIIDNELGAYTVISDGTDWFLI